MIKNLLFDLGGVIIDLCRMNCVASFERLGMKNVNNFLGEYSQKGPFLQLEEGLISEDEFRQEIRKLIDGSVTDEQIDNAFCDFLAGIPPHRLEQLRELRKKYNIFMLSNTNSIMWDSRIAEEFRKEGLEREDYFDGMVTSFEAKCIKPNVEIFNFVVSKLGIDPLETLFLDDSQKNLDAASALGFHTQLVSPGDEFYDLITKRYN